MAGGGRRKGAGRKPVLTDPVRAKILDALRAGNQVETSHLFAGISKAVYRETLARDEAFQEQVDRAIADGQANFLARIAMAGTAKERPQWQALAWILERRFPKQFGRRLVEVSGRDGGPIEVEHDLTRLSEEELTALEAILVKAKRR